jgi:hypothetical protein
VKCKICGTDCREAYLNLGAYCCEEHRREIVRRHRAYLDELRREDPLRMPEAFGVPDFDRFALKLAVFLLDRIGPQVRELFRQKGPSLLDPVAMSLELKERILRRLPVSHVVLEEATGLARLFRSGLYSFRVPVPAALVVEAIRRAGLLPLLGIVPNQPGEAPGNSNDNNNKNNQHNQEEADRGA